MYGNTNAPPAVAYSAIIYSLRCMVTRDIPLNQVLRSVLRMLRVCCVEALYRAPNPLHPGTYTCTLAHTLHNHSQLLGHLGSAYHTISRLHNSTPPSTPMFTHSGLPGTHHRAHPACLPAQPLRNCGRGRRQCAHQPEGD